MSIYQVLHYIVLEFTFLAPLLAIFKRYHNICSLFALTSSAKLGRPSTSWTGGFCS